MLSLVSQWSMKMILDHQLPSSSHDMSRRRAAQCSVRVLGLFVILTKAGNAQDVIATSSKYRPGTAVNVSKRLAGFHLILLLSRDTAE